MHSPIHQLCKLLDNTQFPSKLSAVCKAVSISQEEPVFLYVEASLGSSRGPISSDRILLGSINLQNGQVVSTKPDPGHQASSQHDHNASKEDQHYVQVIKNDPPVSPDTHQPPPEKRRKVISSFQPVPDNYASSVRQVHMEPRFPQRKKPTTEAPILEPTSTDKLIAGIWRQLFSPVQLARSSTIDAPKINIRTGASGEVFRAANILCMKYYNQSQSSRALEMIVQAYWIECYEARIAVIQLENPRCSSTEARMAALKDACSVLCWKEKDLRNRMAIWRGYKEIKDAGGWASLVFASTGVYRFCKYRTGFGDGLATRLRNLRSAFEVAADTLHPKWRDLLQVIGQGNEPRRYHGHPHEWVTVQGSENAEPLASTYGHLDLPQGFQFRFIDECVLDSSVFGRDDPRVISDLEDSTDTCQICKEKQTDDIKTNQCTCFPSLFGSVRSPAPVQIFRTPSGKNNGVVARCNIDRGTAIGEFTGLVTKGIQGVDVMVGGSGSRTYQIFQGQVGNFTRFINHSCRPNSQFERFYWRGKERILVVSRGIVAGSEVTVDYSDNYWRSLDKKCLCGEWCCRFGDR